MTCPVCGCDPDNPWGCDCDNEDCPCSEGEDEDDAEMFNYPVPLGDDAARLLGY